MIFRLNQLTHEIFSGHTFRSGIKNDAAGDCNVIQMSSLDPYYTRIAKPLLKIKSNMVSGKQFLKKGDVLFCAKGNNNFAFVIKEDDCAVAASLFFIIRPDKSKISSEYLAWFINQETTQGQLHSSKEGTSVTNISKKSLEELQIKLPSLVTQNKLVNLYKLWQIEKSKTMNLIKEKEKFYNNLVLNEIESEYEAPLYTDSYGQWAGYLLLSNHNIAHIVFRESIMIKGNTHPIKELHAIITDMESYQREVKNEDGSTESYPAVKHWEVFKFNKTNLDKWNGRTDPKIPQEQVREEILNLIPHALIESITMIDGAGNAVNVN
jgi:hypothetical protein